MFESVCNFIVSAAPTVIVFFIGWFFASDKNRTELYKVRLSAYDALLIDVQYLAHLEFAILSGANIETEDIYNAKVSLSQLRMQHAIYLSNDFRARLSDLISNEEKTVDNINTILADIFKIASKDLHIKYYDAMTHLSVAELGESYRVWKR